MVAFLAGHFGETVMEMFSQVFVDLGFQARLKKRDSFYQVEIFYFLQLLRQHGLGAIDVPGYSLSTKKIDLSLYPAFWVVWLKVKGEWVKLWLSIPDLEVAVLCDRQPPV